MSMFISVKKLKRINRKNALVSVKPQFLFSWLARLAGLSRIVPSSSRTHIHFPTESTRSSYQLRTSTSQTSACVLKNMANTYSSTSSSTSVITTDRSAPLMPFAMVTTSGKYRKSLAMRESRSIRAVRSAASSLRPSWPPSVATSRIGGRTRVSMTISVTRNASKRNQESMRQSRFLRNAPKRTAISKRNTAQKRWSMKRNAGSEA
mmetsp:Transcript_38305/g.102721  ORF Transcript_38305/g.102721 Transcript_38305/m.102721 type:complete len:206 (-) Transcript_38305:511-1128(-)